MQDEIYKSVCLVRDGRRAGRVRCADPGVITRTHPSARNRCADKAACANGGCPNGGPITNGGCANRCPRFDKLSAHAVAL